MGRFRCPSASSSSIDSNGSNPRRVDNSGRVSKVAKMTVRPEPVASSTGAGTKSKSKRKRSKPDDQKKAMIKEAHRLDKLRMNMRAKQLHVFVGNIPPATTEVILNNIFKPCGAIEDICIRCSAGAAVMTGQINPTRTTRDRQYATIQFTRPRAITKALKLNGTEILGQKIVVCLSAAQLPEVQEIARWRVDAIKERKGTRKPKPTGYRGLMPTPTEPMIYGQATKTQADASTSGASEIPKRQAPPLVRNFMFWGMTFAKTVI